MALVGPLSSAAPCGSMPAKHGHSVARMSSRRRRRGGSSGARGSASPVRAAASVRHSSSKPAHSPAESSSIGMYVATHATNSFAKSVRLCPGPTSAKSIIQTLPATSRSKLPPCMSPCTRPEVVRTLAPRLSSAASMDSKIRCIDATPSDGNDASGPAKMRFFTLHVKRYRNVANVQATL